MLRWYDGLPLRYRQFRPNRPHEFVRRRLTGDRLKNGVLLMIAPSDWPCDVCGGSQLSAVHWLVPYRPGRVPDEVWDGQREAD